MQATFVNRYALRTTPSTSDLADRDHNTAVFQSLCGVTVTPPDKNVMVCNIEDLELKHCIYDATQNAWVKKPPAPQPTLSLYVTHYPSGTRMIGLLTSLRRPTKAALVSVVVDTGCQSCLAGVNLLQKLGLTERVLNKTRLQMSAANGNKLDIIGAMALRLSASATHGSTETRQIVYICRDTRQTRRLPHTHCSVDIVDSNTETRLTFAIGKHELPLFN